MNSISMSMRNLFLAITLECAFRLGLRAQNPVRDYSSVEMTGLRAIVAAEVLVLRVSCGHKHCMLVFQEEVAQELTQTNRLSDQTKNRMFAHNNAALVARFLEQKRQPEWLEGAQPAIPLDQAYSELEELKSRIPRSLWSREAGHA